jgi:hypothetical protein
MGWLTTVSGGQTQGVTTMSAAAPAPSSATGGGGSNALLEQEGLPKFKKIGSEAVVPAIRQLSASFM